MFLFTKLFSHFLFSLVPQQLGNLPLFYFMFSFFLPRLCPHCVSLSVWCDFTDLALWWHSVPLLSGSSPPPRLQVKSILTHRPPGPNWTVTEFIWPRWAPATKLRINGGGARAGQKNQCLFIQTWQSWRPSNSPTCSFRYSFCLSHSLMCVMLFPVPRMKCMPCWEDGAGEVAAVATLSSVCPLPLVWDCAGSAGCFW